MRLLFLETPLLIIPLAYPFDKYVSLIFLGREWVLCKTIQNKNVMLFFYGSNSSGILSW